MCCFHCHSMGSPSQNNYTRKSNKRHLNKKGRNKIIPIWNKKQQLDPDMEQQTGSKFGKKYVKALYCHPAYLTYMQSTSCKNDELDESQAGIKTIRRNINNLRHADDTTLMAENEEELQ